VPTCGLTDGESGGSAEGATHAFSRGSSVRLNAVIGIEMDGASAVDGPRLEGKQMRLRYAGVCRTCASPVAAKSAAVYFASAKQIECLTCFESAASATAPIPDSAPAAPCDVAVPPVAATSGTAGASAQREFARRASKREQRVRERHPRIGGFLLAISDDPQSTKAWNVGAAGERKLGQRLDGLADQGALVLHDRRIPGSRANIDHVVVSPSGIWVIDAKRYRGRPQRRVDGGILRPRVEKLIVGGRDCTKLVAGVHKQIELVAAAVGRAAFGDVTIRGMLCFVEADWPLIGGSFSIEGVAVLWPKKAAELVTAPGDLAPSRVIEIQRYLAEAFPAA
jgi:hypothetical protein